MSDPTQTVEPTAVAEPVEPQAAEELVVDDLTVDDVSIDGMCGVY